MIDAAPATWRGHRGDDEMTPRAPWAACLCDARQRRQRRHQPVEHHIDGFGPWSMRTACGSVIHRARGSGGPAGPAGPAGSAGPAGTPAPRGHQVPRCSRPGRCSGSRRPGRPRRPPRSHWPGVRSVRRPRGYGGGGGSARHRRQRLRARCRAGHRQHTALAYAWMGPTLSVTVAAGQSDHIDGVAVMGSTVAAGRARPAVGVPSAAAGGALIHPDFDYHVGLRVAVNTARPWPSRGDHRARRGHLHRRPVLSGHRGSGRWLELQRLGHHEGDRHPKLAFCGSRSKCSGAQRWPSVPTGAPMNIFVRSAFLESPWGWARCSWRRRPAPWCAPPSPTGASVRSRTACPSTTRSRDVHRLRRDRDGTELGPRPLGHVRRGLLLRRARRRHSARSFRHRRSTRYMGVAIAAARRDDAARGRGQRALCHARQRRQRRHQPVEHQHRGLWPVSMQTAWVGDPSGSWSGGPAGPAAPQARLPAGSAGPAGRRPRRHAWTCRSRRSGRSCRGGRSDGSRGSRRLGGPRGSRRVPWGRLAPPVQLEPRVRVGPVGPEGPAVVIISGYAQGVVPAWSTPRAWCSSGPPSR